MRGDGHGAAAPIMGNRSFCNRYTDNAEMYVYERLLLAVFRWWVTILKKFEYLLLFHARDLYICVSACARLVFISYFYTFCLPLALIRQSNVIMSRM